MEINEILIFAATAIAGAIIMFIALKLVERGQLSTEQFQRLKEWVIIAVRAARKTLADKSGDAKRDYAAEVLDAVGYNLNDAHVRAVLETTLDEFEEYYPLTTGDSIKTLEGKIDALETALSETEQGPSEESIKKLEEKVTRIESNVKRLNGAMLSGPVLRS